MQPDWNTTSIAVDRLQNKSPALNDETINAGNRVKHGTLFNVLDLLIQHNLTYKLNSGDMFLERRLMSTGVNEKLNAGTRDRSERNWWSFSILDINGVDRTDDDAIGNALYLEYLVAKRRWRRFTGKPPRTYRRFHNRRDIQARHKHRVSQSPFARSYAAFLPSGAFAGGQGKGKGKGKDFGRKNPRGKDGKTLLCATCGSDTHLWRQCPNKGQVEEVRLLRRHPWPRAGRVSDPYRFVVRTQWPVRFRCRVGISSKCCHIQPESKQTSRRPERRATKIKGSKVRGRRQCGRSRIESRSFEAQVREAVQHSRANGHA